MKIRNNPTNHTFLNLRNFHLCSAEIQQNLNSLNNKIQKRIDFRISINSFFFENKNLKEKSIRIDKTRKPSEPTDDLR